MKTRKEKRISKTIDWSMLDKKEVLNKKIIDIVFFEDQDGDELHILLEDGKQIEIMLHSDGYVHIQSD